MTQEDKRVFLGWDKPIVEKVSDYLLGDRNGREPIDLRDVLVVVPTLQAGRRLREVLARHGAARGAALLSAAIVTPHHFFSLDSSDRRIAGPAVARIVWTRALTAADPARFASLFPAAAKHRDSDTFLWALNTGEIIERLRQALADGGYSIAGVLEKHANDLEEIDRWQDLARLEKLYLDELKTWDLADSCAAKMDRAASPQLDPEVKRIVMAGVPDPSLLAIRALEKLAETRRVEVLVHADPDLRACFDDWGRPIPDKWAEMKIDIPDWESNVFLEASPATQSARVRDVLASDSGKFGPADIGIGVPDVSVIPFLKKDLPALNLSAFDPSNVPFGDHPLGRLIERMFDLMQSSAYEPVAALLRHPDFLRHLEEKHGLRSLDLLRQLDEFQNHYLPPDLETMVAPFRKNPAGSDDKRRDFTALGRALEALKTHLDSFANAPFEDAWRSFLRSVYELRAVDRSIVQDREFENAAAVVEQTLRELRDLPAGRSPLANNRLSAVFIRRLREQSFPRERTDEIVDLLGWLELAWSDAPFLVVTGVNEEFVPGGSLSDVFLPDSLRALLHLRDDLSRFGRDVFLMRTLVESRRKAGRVCFIVGKSSMSGDPLRPSRLMFRCPNGALSGRAERLFKSIEVVDPRPAAEVIFRLRPASAEKGGKIPDEKRISVTAFSDYLACPFRFYLKHVLEMEELNDEKVGLDALDFGSLVHGVLKEMASDPDLWACADADKLAKNLAALAEAMTSQRYGSPPPLAVQVSLDSAIQRLKALAQRQIPLVREGWKIIGFEKKVPDFACAGFKITGMIDRIDRNDKDGRIRITDYKTSDTDESPGPRHLARREATAPEFNRLEPREGKGGKGRSKGGGERKWIDLQLPLYHLLYTGKEALQPGIELAYFNLPKAVSATGISVWDDFDAPTMASAIACVQGVLDRIRNGVFWPPAETVRYDDDFKTLLFREPDKAFDTRGFVR